MLYFLKKSDFKINNKDIDISLSSSFTKRERAFFLFCLDIYDKSREEFLILEYSIVKELIRLNSDDEYQNFFQRLSNKRVYYKISEKNENVSHGIFNVFELFSWEKDKLIVSFSTEVKISFSRNNLFNRINLSGILCFSNELSKHVYFRILKENKKEGELEFSLHKLRNFVGIGDEKYSRFYDFEKNFLLDMKEDITNFAEITVDYEKIKSGEMRSNRVTGVKIKYIDKYIQLVSNETNRLIKNHARYIDNFDNMFTVIRSAINLLGVKKLEQELKKISKECDKNGSNFDMLVEKIIK